MSSNPNIHPVTICNSALIKIGGKTIVSLEDSSKEARICNLQYPKLKQALLMEHPWKFALKRTFIAAEATAPAWEWDKSYPLPQDCGRLLRTSLDDCGYPYTVEGTKLLTNESEVGILYMSNAVPENEFSESFAELLSLRLAMDICYSIVQSVSLKERITKDYEDYLRAARSYSAQEGKPLDFLTNDEGIFIQSRR